MNKVIGLALTAALIAGASTLRPAVAGEVTLDAPLNGATLHSNDVALSVYYIHAIGDKVEVVVTYIGDNEPDQPHRIVMTLSDGDNLSFGLPGYSGKLYQFARKGDAVAVTETPVRHDAGKTSGM